MSTKNFIQIMLLVAGIMAYLIGGKSMGISVGFCFGASSGLGFAPLLESRKR